MFYTTRLDAMMPDWRSKKVSIVAFPVPPTPVKGVVHCVDAWRSDVLERGAELLQSKGYDVVGSRMSDRFGPTFAFSVTLGMALRTEAAFCANVTYAHLAHIGSHDYSNDVVIENIVPIASSCHPGSHCVVPGAPFLTLFHQLALANDNVDRGVVFADDSDWAEFIGLHIDYHVNNELDKAFGDIGLTDCSISDHNGKVYLQPYISDRLQGIVKTVLAMNEMRARERNKNERKGKM